MAGVRFVGRVVKIAAVVRRAGKEALRAAGASRLRKPTLMSMHLPFRRIKTAIEHPLFTDTERA